MATPANPRITIELEAGADPIRGAIERANGRRQPFWGWLELIEELRRAAAEDPRTPPKGPKSRVPGREPACLRPIRRTG